jgi:hypothetical protein
MCSKRITIGFLLGLLLMTAAASASTIVATGVDASRGGGIWIREDGVDVSAYFAGVIFIRLTEDGVNYDRDTLCVDLFTDIYLSQTYETHVLHPNNVPGKHLERVSWLVDNALLPTQEPSFASLLPVTDWVTSWQQGAGLQLAVWDIVHDGGDGFSSGRVQAGQTTPTDAVVLAWAQSYEASSAGMGDNYAYIYQNTIMGSTQPAQMLAGPRFVDGGPTPNPEPATMLMAGTALVSMVTLIRRRRARS